jgi:hypothetical protein
MNANQISRLAWTLALGTSFAACEASPLSQASPLFRSDPAAVLATTVPNPLLLALAQAALQSPGASPSPQPPLPPGHPVTSPPSLPPGHPPLGQVGVGSTGKPEEVAKGAPPVVWKSPEGWVAEKPSSAMRKAQYRVPGPGGDAECVVFYFGPGEGGDAMANATRWASQFQTADGRQAPSVLKTQETTAGGLSVLRVEVVGTYIGGMGGTTSAEKQGYMLLGAIARGPDANWFFKLTGPEATVKAGRAQFDQMVHSLKPGA